jgi:hypothetical protein
MQRWYRFDTWYSLWQTLEKYPKTEFSTKAILQHPVAVCRSNFRYSDICTNVTLFLILHYLKKDFYVIHIYISATVFIILYFNF